MTPIKDVTIRQTNEVSITLDYNNPQVIQTIRDTFARGATPEEFTMFLGLCKGTGLNPYKKEIWFIKTRSGAQIMTGVNGYYAIANNHPQYDGCEVETVGEQEVTEGKLTLKVPVKAVCKVYRKDRRIPTTAEAYWEEYSKPIITQYGNKSLWGQMPRVMLSKCAESIALRKAFPQELNGTYTAEEMPAEYSHDTHDTQKTIAVTADGGQGKVARELDDPENTGALVPKEYWKERNPIHLGGRGFYPAKCTDGQFYIFQEGAIRRANAPVEEIPFADDMPDWMESQSNEHSESIAAALEVKKYYQYDLNKVPADKISAVVDWCGETGIVPDANNIIVSDTPLKKLERFEIK